MYSRTLSIGPRGQITLPKKIRDLFKSKAVIIELNNDNQAVLSPVPDISGIIADYKKDSDLSFDEIRKMAWHKSRSNI